MDAGELTVRFEELQKDLEEEGKTREKDTRYLKHIVEDVQARYHDIALQITSIKQAFTSQQSEGVTVKRTLDVLDDRLRKIERLAWIAVGGILVIGGVITLIGLHLHATFS